MLIGLVKHLCPGTGVETTGIAMQSNNSVPTRIMHRIEDLQLERFAARFRLEGVVVQEGRRFFHF